MAEPTDYERGYSFTDYQADRPSKPLPGDELDNELDNIANALGETQTALRDVRRSDGKLQNGIVTADALDETAVGALFDMSQELIEDTLFITQMYLGQLPEDPTEGRDGAELTEANWYFNTTSNSYRFWNGASWEPLSGTGTMQTYFYVATAGQTVIQGEDENGEAHNALPGAAVVSMNGAVLVYGRDYTIPTAGRIVLAEAAAADDEFTVITFTSLSMTDIGKIQVSSYTGDGVTVTFGLPSSVVSATNVRVSIDGVHQHRGQYTVSGSSVTLNEAPPSGSAVEVEVYALLPLGSATASQIELADETTLQDWIDKYQPGQVVTPQMFGANGNDSGDDTAALQAAIDFCKAAGTIDGGGGKLLYIPPGIYRTTGVVVDRPITMKGAGGRRTRFRKLPGGTSPTVLISPAHDGADYVSSTSLFAHISISGIHLIGAGKSDSGAADGWRIQNASVNPVYTLVTLDDISAWAHAGNGLKGNTYSGPVYMSRFEFMNNKLCGADINSCVDWRIGFGDVGSNELDSLLIAGCVQMRLFGVYVYSGGRFSANFFNSQVEWHGGAIDASTTHGLNYDCRRTFDYCKLIDVDFRKNGFNSSPDTYADIYVRSGATNELYLQNCGFEYPNNGSSLYNIQFEGTGNFVTEAGSRFEGGDVDAPNVTNAPGQLRSVGRHMYSRGDRNYSTLPMDVVTDEQFTGQRWRNSFVNFAAIYGATTGNANGVLDLYEGDGSTVGQRLAAPGSGVPSRITLPGPFDDDTAALSGGVTSGNAYRQTGGGVAYVGGGASGGSINANTAYASRAAAAAATIPPTQNTLRWYDGGALLEAKREPSVITRPCITTNGGAVYWSPVGQIEAAHYGIVPGTVANGRIEYATLDAASRGQRLYFRGSATPYTVTDTHIFHCQIYGDGASGIRSAGVETIIQNSGAGTARQWHDKGTGTSADDMSRPILVAGRSELMVADIRVLNAAGWEHDIIFPATRGSVLWRVKTGRPFGATSGGQASGVSVVFDQTWSDRNTALMALHPTIVPGAGCNECMTFDCDLGGSAEGIGIIGTVRNPDDYPVSTDWLWGWGGASDFQDYGSRVTGIKIDAACKNAAKMVQGIDFRGTAPRVGSREFMLTVDRGTRVTFSDSYAETSGSNVAKVAFTSRTARAGEEKITFRNVDWGDNLVYMDGVSTGVGINNGGGGLAFLDISTSDGVHYQSGMVYGPDGFRPRVSRGASAGTSSYPFEQINTFKVRSREAALWFRTYGTSGENPGYYFSMGNKLVRGFWGQNLFAMFDPALLPPGADDPEGELPTSPFNPTDGLHVLPDRVRPATDGGQIIGDGNHHFAEVWSPSLRSSTAIDLNAPAITANSMTLPRGTTRAALVTAVAGGFDPGVGAVIFADGYGYRRVSGATTIADLPGYEPYGDASPDHWGIAVGTDETAKITAMLNWTSARGVTVEWGPGPYVFGDYALTADTVLVKWRSRTGKTVLRSNKSVPDGPAYEDDAFVRFNAQTKASGLLSGGLMANATQITLPDTAVAEATAGRSMVSILSDRVIETDDRGQARIGYTAPIERVVSSTVVEIGMPNPVLLHSGTDLGATITAVGADTVTVAAFVGRDVSEMRYRLTFDTVGGSASTVTALPSEFDPDTGTFTLEDMPVGLVVGDTLSIKREISFFLFDGARIDIQGIEFERDYHTGATSGDLGFRCLVIARAKDPIVQNCVFRNFSEGGVRVDSCYGGDVGYLRAINCNRAYGTTDGTGYGVSVFQSSRGAYHHITGFGCRRTLDFGGTQAISWDNTTNEIAGYGGGLTYTGSAFWPSGTIEQSVVGSHGGACRTEYSQSRGHDVKSVVLLRGKDEVVRGVYGSGKITELLRSYIGDGCNASGFYYTDERPDWISDPDLYAKGTRNGKLETCITIVGTIQPDRQFAFSDFHIRGVWQSVVSLQDAPVIGSLVLGGVIDIAIDDEENSQSTFWYIRNGGTGSATINGIVDMGRPCIRTKGSAPKKITFNWMAFTTFILPDGVPVKMPNGEVRFYLSDDAVAKFPVQRNGCGVLDLRTVAASRPQWCQGIMLTVSGRQYTAGVFSGMDFLGVVPTGTTGTDGNVNVAYTPAGGENVLYVENRRGARELFTMRFSELAL